MKRILVSSLGIVISMASCHKVTSQNDLIRDGIRQHLVSLKTINLSAMDINVTSVAINGNTAQAQVEYLPKSGAPPGAGMRVSYSMEKTRRPMVCRENPRCRWRHRSSGSRRQSAHTKPGKAARSVAEF